MKYQVSFTLDIEAPSITEAAKFFIKELQDIDEHILTIEIITDNYSTNAWIDTDTLEVRLPS